MWCRDVCQFKDERSALSGDASLWHSERSLPTDYLVNKSRSQVMMPGLAPTILIPSLPFLVEGVNGLGATPLLKKRQGKLSSPTPIQCLHAFPDPTPTYGSVSSSFLFLNDFRSSLTACTSVNVTWVYAGPPLLLDLIATNVGVTPQSSQASRVNTFTDDQAFSVPSGASQPQPVRVSIAQGILPQASVVPWNVNVSTGWYQSLQTSIQHTWVRQIHSLFNLGLIRRAF